MTGAQIVTAAQQLYNEETGDYIPSTYLQARLNDLKARVEVRTRVYRVSNAQNLTDSTRTYILPAGWFALRRRTGVCVTPARRGRTQRPKREEVQERSAGRLRAEPAHP